MKRAVSDCGLCDWAGCGIVAEPQGRQPKTDFQRLETENGRHHVDILPQKEARNSRQRKNVSETSGVHCMRCSSRFDGEGSKLRSMKNNGCSGPLEYHKQQAKVL